MRWTWKEHPDVNIPKEVKMHKFLTALIAIDDEVSNFLGCCITAYCVNRRTIWTERDGKPLRRDLWMEFPLPVNMMTRLKLRRITIQGNANELYVMI